MSNMASALMRNLKATAQKQHYCLACKDEFSVEVSHCPRCGTHYQSAFRKARETKTKKAPE